MNSDFYVYQFLREEPSKHGPVGTPYYIGKGRGKRAWSTSRVIPKPKNRAFVVIIKRDLSELEAFKLERHLISHYGRIDLGTGCLRNLTDGGEGNTGFIPSVELRAVWSAQRIGNKYLLGKKFSKETRERMSEAHRGKKRSSEFSAKMSRILKGMPKSQEHRKNMSLSRLGKPGHATKGRTGQPHKEETKKKMAEARKKWWAARKAAHLSTNLRPST